MKELGVNRQRPEPSILLKSHIIPNRSEKADVTKSSVVMGLNWNPKVESSKEPARRTPNVQVIIRI